MQILRRKPRHQTITLNYIQMQPCKKIVINYNLIIRTTIDREIINIVVLIVEGWLAQFHRRRSTSQVQCYIGWLRKCTPSYACSVGANFEFRVLFYFFNSAVFVCQLKRKDL